MATRKISPEANNYVRLDFAVKGPCTECLRDLLKKFVPVGFHDINHALQFLEPHLKQHLESYKYSQLFTNHQLRANFSVQECDMSLVYSLIRNSNWVHPPTRGWGKSFTNSPQDISLGANVERLHLLRNSLEHYEEPSLSNQDFINYWTEVRKCVADIEKSLGSTYHQQSLDRLRGQDMDPEYANRIINEFNDVVRGLQAEQCRQRVNLLDIQMSQVGHVSKLFDITNSLNEQSKDMLDLKTKESNQSNLLRELEVRSEQQYQLLQNDRKVLSDIKTSHDNQGIIMCEVLSALKDDEKGLVHIAKEHNNQMCTLKDLTKKLEDVHANQTLLLNNNRESFKEIQEILESRGNKEARGTDSTDMRNQHQNKADNKEANTDALNYNANREPEISIAKGTNGVICLIKQYVFIKTSLSKTNVMAIVDSFLKEGLISNDEHETIADLYLPRRLRIDHLLKKIILGDSDRLTLFFTVLTSVNSTIARTLATTEVTDQDRSRFKEVEERALQVTNASALSDTECNLDNSEICFFQYHLLAFEEDVDSINDAMLSRFNFSVRDHSNVLHAKTPDEKIQKLCQTMNICSINVEIELSTLLRASLYNKWIEFRKKRGNHDRQHFLKWLNAPVNLVSYVFRCSRLHFNQAETGSIIIKFSIEDGFDITSLTRGSLQENITDLLWKGFMETQINLIKPVHVTVFIMSPRKNGQEEIHFYLDFDTTDDSTTREGYRHDMAIRERKILLEELDPIELSEWITKELDVQKTMIHKLEDKLSRSDMLGKEDMVVFIDSICELENGRYLIKKFCEENYRFIYTKQSETTDQHSTDKREFRMNQPLRFKKGLVSKGSAFQQQHYHFQRAMHTDRAESGISSRSSHSSLKSSDIPKFYSAHEARKKAVSCISTDSSDKSTVSSDSGISSDCSHIPQPLYVEKAQETSVLLEESDPTELTEWITNQLDAHKTKVNIVENKLSKTDMHGKEAMIILLDSLCELENGRDVLKRFCKQNDPYVYKKIFSTTDQTSTEMHESPIEKPLQYERGGGLQRLYSFWIDISTDPKGMETFHETEELLRNIVDKRDDVDENATIKPQNLEISPTVISSGYSDKTPSYHAHEVLETEMKLLKPSDNTMSKETKDLKRATLDERSSKEFPNPEFSYSDISSGFGIEPKIQKTDDDPLEPTAWKDYGITFVIQVGKLDQVLSDVMVIFGNSRSSLDLPRTIIETVGPQIQREFRDKYPNGLSKEEVAVLSGFNLPVWKIFYCECSEDQIMNCVKIADKLKMRSILFLVQNKWFARCSRFVGIGKNVMFYNHINSISTIYFHVDQDTLEWKKLRKIAEVELFTKDAFFSPYRVGRARIKLSANPEPKVFNVGQLTVVTQVGKMEEIQSDITVIFEMAKGQWPTENLPSEVLEKAGPMIQKEFKEKYPAGLEYAEVAVLNGYNLPFRKILYGVLPHWPVKWLKQVIEVFLTECFQLSSNEGIKSISFVIPSVTYDVAKMYAYVLHSCVELLINKPSFSISTQNIVIKDGCTGANMLKQVFEEEWSRRIVFTEGHVTVVIRERLLEENLHQPRIGKYTLRCAMLSEEPQESLIIPDSKALVIISDFKNIATLLEEIGPTLKAEFATKYKSYLANGEVAILDGHSNPFRKIYCISYRSFEIIDVILECFQMAQNDKMNSIILLSHRPKWPFKELTRELILGLKIFFIENPSSIRRLYLDSETYSQEIFDDTSVKVFKEGHVTVVLNARYNYHDYIGCLRPAYDGRPAEKMKSVHVICNNFETYWGSGEFNMYLEDMMKEERMYLKKSFTSEGVFILEHILCNTVRVFCATPGLSRQNMDKFFYECFQMADVNRVSSVTFLVPGYCKKIKLLASTLSSCVKRFAANTPSSSIKRYYIRIAESNSEETKQVIEKEWAKATTSGGKQGYPSEDLYLKKAMTYSKVAEQSKEGSKYVPDLGKTMTYSGYPEISKEGSKYVPDFKKAMTYSKVAEKSKEGSSYVPQEEVD